MRPPLFVGSSKESLAVAYALQENLEDCAEVTVWTQGIFQLTKSTLQSLLDTLDGFEFAVFVFSDDDVTKIRAQEVSTIRDNVVFEFGLFLGRLGPERTFFVVPKDSPELHIPTDLLGVTPAFYDAKREDQNLTAALGPASNRIRAAIQRITKPFDDALYERFENLGPRIRRLFIARIISSDRASEFPTESELSRLPMGELASIYRLARPNVMEPEDLRMLHLTYLTVGGSLYEEHGDKWECAVLLRELEELENTIAKHEQT